MSNGSREKVKSDTDHTRRGLLKSLSIGAGSVLVGGTGLSAADQTSIQDASSTDKPHLPSFNPNDNDDVKRVAQYTEKFENGEKLGKAIETLSGKEQEALIDALSPHNIEVSVDHAPVFDKSSISQNSGKYTTNVVGNRLSIKTKINGAFGVKALRFFHHLVWKYDSTGIKSKRHYKTYKILKPGWHFEKVTTDKLFKTTRKTGISVLEGKFRFCLSSNLGCIRSVSPGSRIVFHNNNFNFDDV